MPHKRKRLWIGLCLLNLCIVALFGVLLRSKILFSLPALDYTHFLNAHSHFAFTGWVGLSLFTLLIYELLPEAVAQRNIYQMLLAGIEISALGMAITFPITGYAGIAVVFSTLYIILNFVFAPVFIKDLLRHPVHPTVRLLSACAIGSLLVSALGPLGLVFALKSKPVDAILYRDSIYTFLHFQYNGFFTLAVFALLINHVHKKGIVISRQAVLFARLLCLSVVPALFLSLLWQGNFLFYVLAATACVLLLASLFYFVQWIKPVPVKTIFAERLVRTLWILSALSFGLKLLLQVGTIIPVLGQAVYGDRPVIIGFLHLVFLGFVSFFLLALFAGHGYFKKLDRTAPLPFAVFGAGVITNEVLLMLQGVGNLLRTTSAVFNQLLWGGSVLLLAGAVLLAAAYFRANGRRELL